MVCLALALEAPQVPRSNLWWGLVSPRAICNVRGGGICDAEMRLSHSVFWLYEVVFFSLHFNSRAADNQ